MMTTEVTSEIEQQNREFEKAFNGARFGDLAALYTEHARALPPGSAAVQGRPAIEALWRAANEAGIKHLKLHTGTVDAVGDTAYEVSTATLTSGPGDTQDVKYVVIWRRNPGGLWQLAVDIWNS
jgi:ketosteroid isomerase-like protein